MYNIYIYVLYIIHSFLYYMLWIKYYVLNIDYHILYIMHYVHDALFANLSGQRERPLLTAVLLSPIGFYQLFCRRAAKQHMFAATEAARSQNLSITAGASSRIQNIFSLNPNRIFFSFCVFGCRRHLNHESVGCFMPANHLP